jgi:hypothetical protein
MEVPMNSENDGINPEAAPSGTGCAECLAAGTWWFHLRRCAECGCCDDSLHKHASKHAHASGHPVIQSFEPGEDWFYDYRTDDMFDGPSLNPPHSHPHDQPTPGPAGLVPRRWQAILTQGEENS